MTGWLTVFSGIARREALRFVNQRGRFLAALVRPLVWLFIFAAGFRAVLGLSITPPYQTYVLYEVYVTPGLCAMIQLFNGMQSSLSMVYDRETGAMRTLLVETRMCLGELRTTYGDLGTQVDDHEALRQAILTAPPARAKAALQAHLDDAVQRIVAKRG